MAGEALTYPIVLSGADYFWLLVFLAFLYVYTALALSKIAKNANVPHPWLAWIPIGNVILMANIAKMPWWPVLLFVPYAVAVMIATFIPAFWFVAVACIIALTVFATIWQWKMYEVAERPGWWSFVGLILGVLAFLVTLIDKGALTPACITLYVLAIFIPLGFIGNAAWGKRKQAVLPVENKMPEPNVEHKVEPVMAPVESDAPAPQKNVISNKKTEKKTTKIPVKKPKVVKKTAKKTIKRTIARTVKKTIKKSAVKKSKR